MIRNLVRFLLLGGLVLAVAPVQASVSITPTRTVAAGTLPSLTNSATGAWNVSSTQTTTAAFASAAQNTTITDPAGPFSGTGSVSVRPLGGIASAESSLIVDLAITGIYNYSFSWTQLGGFFIGNGAAQAFSTASFESLTTNTTLFSFNIVDGSQSGQLTSGNYRLKVSTIGDGEGVLPSAVNGSFDFKFGLEEVPQNVVPEPASIATWICLGAVGFVGARKRMRASV
ncbi:MAG: hypothetical protein SGJ19_13680 [Planctomycetia bacterium]|nr:hypothetical protein [Planctomycetia bacterium]